VGLRTGLDWCGKSRPTGIQSPDRPARRQSLYRLRYSAHPNRVVLFINCDVTIAVTIDNSCLTTFGCK